MKYIKTYESFKPVNEEFIFNMLKKLYTKTKEIVNKVNGGKEVEAIKAKYTKLINDQLAKQAKVSLNLKSEEELMKNTNKPQQPKLDNQSFKFLNEADEAPKGIPLADEKTDENDPNEKLDADTLRQKQSIIKKVIDIQKDAAKKEMEAVLKKKGGAGKNPQLATIIDNKIREFDLDLLNAEIEYLEKAGDKEAVKKLSTNRDKISKELDASYNNLGNVDSVEIEVDGKKFKIGKKYRYKNEKGVKTIIIKSKSKEENKVVASYTFGDTKDKDQQFQVSNIDLDFKPEVGKKYTYFSESNGGEIEVEVLANVDDKGMVKVKAGKNEFNVESGALLEQK